VKRLLIIFLFILITQARGSLRESPVVLAVERASPVVVNLNFEVANISRTPFGGDAFFEKFFGDFFDRLAGFTTGSNIIFTQENERESKLPEVLTLDLPEELGQELGLEWLGLGVKVNSPALRKKLKLISSRNLVVSEVVRGGAAFNAGIRPGDLLRRINGAELNSLKEFNEAVLAASFRETVVLVVQRGRVAYHLSLTP
jgi:S1-C subfamily serine protease